MITELILTIILFTPKMLLVMLTPVDFNLQFDSEFMQGVTELTKGAYYLMPIAGLLPIFTIRIGLSIFKVILAFIVRTKSFIPTSGGA